MERKSIVRSKMRDVDEIRIHSKRDHAVLIKR